MPPVKDPRIDAYIAGAAPFARPILKRLRKCVHSGCPSAVETLKWGHPSFTLDGRILAFMAAFKAHAAFGFWNHEGLKDHGLKTADEKTFGQLGKLKGPDDLPTDATLVRLVKAAVAMHAAGLGKRPKPQPKPRKLDVPPDLLAALRKNKKALATFEAFAPSHKRDYVEWITSAKRDETRARRLATAIEWMAEGKKHNWKYMS